jgi:hypothetical protein
MKAVSIHASGDDFEEIAYVNPDREDDDDEFLGMDSIDDWVLWFGRQSQYIRQFDQKLQYFDKLAGDYKEGQLWIDLNGEQHVLPTHMGDEHGAYIALSSIAWLLKDSYDFWLLKHLMDDVDDRHAMLVTTKVQSVALTANYPGPVSRWFIPLKLGHDYFCGIDVPYLDHEDHNPLFDAQREAVAPIIRRIREQWVQRNAELSEEHRESQAWQKALKGIAGKSEPEELSRVMQMCTQADAKRTAALESHDQKMAQFRQEIAQIVQQTEK